jgi:hypothetical protein
LISQSRANTSRTPPDISLPTVMPPQRPANLQRSTTMFALGTPTRRPSSSRPDFTATQSSLVSNRQPLMCTSVQASGSQPSVLDRTLWTVTSRTVTLRDSTGWIVHIGGSRIVTSLMRTSSQR